jgi:hypothetical protein
MQPRRALPPSNGGQYFGRQTDEIEFYSSGCKPLDLALPLELVDFGSKDVPMNTVEDFADEMEWRSQNATLPELVVMDSLDSFSSDAEMKSARLE